MSIRYQVTRLMRARPAFEVWNPPTSHGCENPAFVKNLQLCSNPEPTGNTVSISYISTVGNIWNAVWETLFFKILRCLMPSALSAPCGDRWSVRASTIAFTQTWGLCYQWIKLSKHTIFIQGGHEGLVDVIFTNVNAGPPKRKEFWMYKLGMFIPKG